MLSSAHLCFDNMAGKVVLVLFAFLAVQGWTSAGFIPDEVLDIVESSEILDLEEVFDEITQELFEEAPENELFEEALENEISETRNPQKCLPHIQEAYDTALVVRRLINQAKQLAKKLREAAKKCRALTKPEDKKKCFQDLKKRAKAEGKPLKDAYKKVRPKVIAVMGKFDKCMA